MTWCFRDVYCTWRRSPQSQAWESLFTNSKGVHKAFIKETRADVLSTLIYWLKMSMPCIFDYEMKVSVSHSPSSLFWIVSGEMWKLFFSSLLSTHTCLHGKTCLFNLNLFNVCWGLVHKLCRSKQGFCIHAGSHWALSKIQVLVQKVLLWLVWRPGWSFWTVWL